MKKLALTKRTKVRRSQSDVRITQRDLKKDYFDGKIPVEKFVLEIKRSGSGDMTRRKAERNISEMREKILA